LVEHRGLEQVQVRRVLRALELYERERFGGVSIRRPELVELVRLVDAI
jgi:hypothetical protein